MKRITTFGILLTSIVLAAGCMGGGGGGENKVAENNEEMPVFSLATSEYPSWSTFTVAAKAGLINPEKGGKPGSMEKKWGVDIVLHVKDYDPCLTMYGNGAVDAVCITNVDCLNPALGRSSTAILPTSTSDGADKVICGSWHIVGGKDVSKKDFVRVNLMEKKVYGLSKSVSEYVFFRGLEKLELDPKEYKFLNLEPAAAATALQTGSNDVTTICVWNPYALQTLRTRKGSKVLFDSSMIPEEVIDMVVVGNDAITRPGGENFACCICDVFYAICGKMNDPKSADSVLKALGEDFNKLPAEDMRICCKETRFYSSPDAGTALFSNQKFQSTTMADVVRACKAIGILTDKTPTIGYNDANAQLNFSTQYMQKSKSK